MDSQACSESAPTLIAWASRMAQLKLQAVKYHVLHEVVYVNKFWTARARGKALVSFRYLIRHEKRCIPSGVTDPCTGRGRPDRRCASRAARLPGLPSKPDSFPVSRGAGAVCYVTGEVWRVRQLSGDSTWETLKDIVTLLSLHLLISALLTIVLS